MAKRVKMSVFAEFLIPKFRQRLTKAVETPVVSDVIDGILMIGTHNGSFHCDEVVAVSLLSILPQYANSAIVRTRNPEILAKCGIVVDVGAVYDPSTHRYDHHQREFQGVMPGFSTRLSSAGLVYQHFGKDILRELLRSDVDGRDASETLVDVCFRKLYKGFIEHIDAIDNGVSVCEGVPRYNISSTLSDRIHHLNPHWNESQSAELYSERFTAAVNLACSEFLLQVQVLSEVWWPARSIVQQAFDDRHRVHPSGKIAELQTACPWKDHLFEIEAEAGCEGQILYLLYQDSGGSWRVQATPATPTSFESRKKLPSDWCGLRDEVLSTKIDIPGCIFVHASGFIGGHATRDGALAMAALALDVV